MLSQFHCPSDSSHIFNQYEEFRSHLYKCRLLQDKTGYICKYDLTHMYLTKEERNIHEKNCSDSNKDFFVFFNDNNSIKLGTKGRDFIQGPKFEESKVRKVVSCPKHFLNQTNDMNNERPELEIDIQPKKEKNPLVLPLNYDKNEVSQKQSMVRESKSVEPIIKKEKNILSANNDIIISNPTKTNLRLDSLIHTLIIDEGSRVELIVRRRNLMKKLKMKEFSITEYRPLSMFRHIINDQITREAYENEYYIGEYNLFGEKEVEYENFIKKFDKGDIVAVNTSYRESNNEVLLICTNRTNFLGKFIKNGDIAFLLFKFTILYNMVRIHGIQAGPLPVSPWVELIGQKATANQNEIVSIKEEKRSGSVVTEFLKESLKKQPFQFYEKQANLELKLSKEDRVSDEKIDAEIDDLEFKCTELVNLINRKNDQYKIKLSELENDYRNSKQELQQNIQEINILEAKIKELRIEDATHKKIFDEDQQQFALRFNEYFEKQRAHYKEIYDSKVEGLFKDYVDKKKNLPNKEKELRNYAADLEQKKILLKNEEFKSLDLRAKLTEQKQIGNKLDNKQTWLEMHKKLKQTNLEETENYNQDKCTICLKELRNLLFLPCRHLVCCEKCWNNAKNQGIDGCVSCKHEIKQVKKIAWE